MYGTGKKVVFLNSGSGPENLTVLFIYLFFFNLFSPLRANLPRADKFRCSIRQKWKNNFRFLSATNAPRLNLQNFESTYTVRRGISVITGEFRGHLTILPTKLHNFLFFPSFPSKRKLPHFPFSPFTLKRHNSHFRFIYHHFFFFLHLLVFLQQQQLTNPLKP